MFRLVGSIHHRYDAHRRITGQKYRVSLYPKHLLTVQTSIFDTQCVLHIRFIISCSLFLITRNIISTMMQFWTIGVELAKIEGSSALTNISSSCKVEIHFLHHQHQMSHRSHIWTTQTSQRTTDLPLVTV